MNYSSSDVVFTTDTHYGHANIIKYCNRPFSDTAEMDALMLGHFKAADDAGKTVFHMGDLAFNPAHMAVSPWRPKGRHILILGNHDIHANAGGKYRPIYEEFFATIHSTSDDWKTFALQISVDGVPVLLSHDPQRDLRGCKFNIYGHHHNNLMRDPQRFLAEYGWIFGSDKHLNVGVELTDYRPVTFEEAQKIPRPVMPS